MRAILEALPASREDQEQLRLLERRQKAEQRPPLARQRNRPIRWVATEDELRRAVKELAGLDRIALDVETTLGTKALCLIQIATETETCLIDALAVPNLEALNELLGRRSRRS